MMRLNYQHKIVLAGFLILILGVGLVAGVRYQSKLFSTQKTINANLDNSTNSPSNEDRLAKLESEILTLQQESKVRVLLEQKLKPGWRVYTNNDHRVGMLVPQTFTISDDYGVSIEAPRSETYYVTTIRMKPMEDASDYSLVESYIRTDETFGTIDNPYEPLYFSSHIFGEGGSGVSPQWGECSSSFLVTIYTTYFYNSAIDVITGETTGTCNAAKVTRTQKSNSRDIEQAKQILESMVPYGSI